MRALFLASALALSLLACHQAPSSPPPAAVVDFSPVEHPIAGAASKCPKNVVEFRTEGAPAPENPIKRSIGGPVAVEITPIRRFCAKNRENPICTPISGRKLTLAEANAVDSWLRSQFTYTSDVLMHGDDDFYDDNTVCGDCEDYALTLARYLAKKGQAGSAMWLAIWYPDWEGGHATLIIDTEDYGLAEYTVGGTPGANLYDPEHQPVRLGTIQMDGKLAVATYPGVILTEAFGRIILSKEDTRDDARRAGLLKD